MTPSNNEFLIQENHIQMKSASAGFYKIDEPVSVVSEQMTLIHKQAELSRANTLEIEKVKGFLSLTDNWDSYGAAIVSTTAVEKAVDFIRNLSKRRENVYFSSPGPNGEVMVQLKKNNKEIEVIFYENKSRYVTFFNNNFSKQGDYSDQILSDLVEWLNING